MEVDDLGKISEQEVSALGDSDPDGLVEIDDACVEVDTQGGEHL
jgi:hypothetical protein